MPPRESQGIASPSAASFELMCLQQSAHLQAGLLELTLGFLTPDRIFRSEYEDNDPLAKLNMQIL